MTVDLYLIVRFRIEWFFGHIEWVQILHGKQLKKFADRATLHDNYGRNKDSPVFWTD